MFVFDSLPTLEEWNQNLPRSFLTPLWGSTHLKNAKRAVVRWDGESAAQRDVRITNALKGRVSGEQVPLLMLYEKERKKRRTIRQVFSPIPRKIPIFNDDIINSFVSNATLYLKEVQDEYASCYDINAQSLDAKIIRKFRKAVFISDAIVSITEVCARRRTGVTEVQLFEEPILWKPSFVRF